MPNAAHPSKAGQKQNPKTPASHTVEGAKERLTANVPAGTKQVTGKRVRGGIAPAGKALQGAKEGVKSAKLLAGAQLLTKAMSSYAGQVSPGTGGRRARQPSNFQGAYSSMIKAMPKSMRLDVLQQMRRDIEEVAKVELNAALGELAANDDNGRVSTADFMAGLEQQEQQQRQSDMSSERLLPGAEMRARLGVTPQALSAALKAKRMFVMQGSSGEYAYPAFFADSTYDRPVLEKVCKALGDLPAGSKWDFFTSPRTSLGGKTPLDALAKGKVDAVMSAANAFREE